MFCLLGYVQCLGCLMYNSLSINGCLVCLQRQHWDILALFTVIFQDTSYFALTLLFLFLLSDDPALSTVSSHFISSLGFLFGQRIMTTSSVLLPTQIQQIPDQAVSHASRFLLSPRGPGLHNVKPYSTALHLFLPLVLPGLVLNLA